MKWFFKALSEKLGRYFQSEGIYSNPAYRKILSAMSERHK